MKNTVAFIFVAIAISGCTAGVSLNGRVVSDTTGMPLTNARIDIYPKPNEVLGPVAQTYTDSSGRFTLELGDPPDKGSIFSLHVNHIIHEPVSVHVTFQGQNAMHFATVRLQEIANFYDPIDKFRKINLQELSKPK